MGEWARLCRGPGLVVDGDAVSVELADGRQHRVTVRDAGPCYELQATVARPRVLRSIDSPSLLAWTRNRGSRLVGFRVDAKGRLIGETWVPKIGLDPSELQLYVRRLAAECDRFEYLLTGADLE